MPNKHKDTFNLQEDGFCFLPSLFDQSEVESAYQGLWEIINGKYGTGTPPENRFWNPVSYTHLTLPTILRV